MRRCCAHVQQWLWAWSRASCALQTKLGNGSFTPAAGLLWCRLRTPIYLYHSHLAQSAGLRIDPETFSRSRMSYYTGITFAPFTDDLVRAAQCLVPCGCSCPPYCSDVSWQQLPCRMAGCCGSRCSAQHPTERAPSCCVHAGDACCGGCSAQGHRHPRGLLGEAVLGVK